MTRHRRTNSQIESDKREALLEEARRLHAEWNNLKTQQKDRLLATSAPADVAAMWQRALMLLMPSDNSEPNVALFAKMLRSGYPPPTYLLPLIATLLEPEGTDIEYQLVVQPLPKTSRKVQQGFTVLMHVHEVAEQRKHGLGMEEAVEQAVSTFGANRTKIRESLKTFEKAFPEKYQVLFPKKSRPPDF